VGTNAGVGHFALDHVDPGRQECDGPRSCFSSEDALLMPWALVKVGSVAGESEIFSGSFSDEPPGSGIDHWPEIWSSGRRAFNFRIEIKSAAWMSASYSVRSPELRVPSFARCPRISRRACTGRSIWKSTSRRADSASRQRLKAQPEAAGGVARTLARSASQAPRMEVQASHPHQAFCFHPFVNRRYFVPR